MKAIFPCSYYLPETAASLYITDNIVHACAEEGIYVELYTPTPTRNVSKGVIWKRNEDHCNGLLHIHRFRMFGEGKNPIIRAFRYFLCELYLVYKCLFSEYDVAFIDSTPPIQGLKNPLIKLFRRKQVIYNAQDVFPDSLVSTGLATKGGLLWKVGRVIENITYKYSDKIIVISEDFKRNIIAKGVPEEKIVVVYNWVDEEAVKHVPREKNVLFDRYGLDRSKFYITYCGNIGLTQNFQMLTEVAQELAKYEDLVFVLIGNGAYKKNIENFIKEHNVKNIILLPFQPYEEISYVFSLGDIGLVISKQGVGENSVPSKTWSIMSASRPVLANFDENELRDIISDNRCGIFTKAGDKEAFIDAILTLYNNRELCVEYGHNGRDYILNNLTRSVGTKKYVDVIKSEKK